MRPCETRGRDGTMRRKHAFGLYFWKDSWEKRSIRRRSSVGPFWWPSSASGQDERQANEYLDELEFLAETAGIRSVKRFTQRLAAPSAKTFIGEGKLAEIAAFVEENEIRYVIFDDELSPSQLRNLDKVFKNKIYDRTSLILDIFVQRATTAYAKAQVELAQCQYLLPRLAGMWTHLERQRGGTGTRGGAGEREIETDRPRDPQPHQPSQGAVVEDRPPDGRSARATAARSCASRW